MQQPPHTPVQGTVLSVTNPTAYYQPTTVAVNVKQQDYYSAPLLPVSTQSGSLYYETDYDLILVRRRRQRRACGGACSLAICLIIFFTLYYLIPRTPSMVLISTSAGTSPFSITQNFEIYNNNFYALTLENINLKLYSTPLSSGSYTQLTGVGSYVGGGGDSDSLVVTRQSSDNFAVYYNFTSNPTSSLVAAGVYCINGQTSLAVTSGTIQMKTQAHDFGNELISFSVLFTCTN